MPSYHDPGRFHGLAPCDCSTSGQVLLDQALDGVLPGPEQREPCHVCQGRGDVPIAALARPVMRQRCTWCAGTGTEPVPTTTAALADRSAGPFGLAPDGTPLCFCHAPMNPAVRGAYPYPCIAQDKAPNAPVHLGCTAGHSGWLAYEPDRAPADTEATAVAGLLRSDDRHRAQGHVLCWCSRWYPPAELDQWGTCGSYECRRNAVADLQGLVP